VDAVVHVVRCFENDDIIHVEGSIDPARDIETIDLELILSDIEILERRIDKTKKMIKADKKFQVELEFFERVMEALENGKPARSVSCNEEEAELLSTVSLLTNKPIIFAANMSDTDFSEGIVLPHAPGKAHSPMEKEIHKKLYIMNENPMGIKHMRFDFRGESVIWEYENATGEHALTIGLGRNVQQLFPERYCATKIDQKADKGYNCFVSAGWTTEDTLGLHVHVADDYLGQLRMKICFKGDSVNLLGYKHAEWFMDEFVGNATGHRKGE